jgi:hypothetical protein
MKWKDYAYQPTGRVLRRMPIATPESWLSMVHESGAMRVFGDEPRDPGKPAEPPEAALGAYFRPDAPVSLDVLQVAGLLLKDNRLDRHKCHWSARRQGGGLYFQWFLAQLDDSVTDPLPGKEFPLHRSRWRKRRAGRRRQDAEQRVHSRHS